MEQAVRQQIARNEQIFRDVNNAIEAGHWPGDPEGVVTFCCECGRLGCNEMLELTGEAYRRVRENERRFIIVPGHDYPEVEQVVETCEGYLVVEKLPGLVDGD